MQKVISKNHRVITTIFNFYKFLIYHFLFYLKLGVKNGKNIMHLQYNTQEVENVLIFSLQEEKITHDLASDLKETIFLKITEGFSKIVLDMSNVKEIDSSGLGALLFGKRQANGNEGDLKLVGVSEAVENMIRIAQLTRVFETYKGIKEAIKALK